LGLKSQFQIGFVLKQWKQQLFIYIMVLQAIFSEPKSHTLELV